jgi:hypothetical protein
MSYCTHEENYRGFEIKIMADEDPCNPVKEYDMFGRLAVIDRCRYDFGHETFSDPEDFEADLVAQKAVWLPVFMYNHSGITINTSGFSCPWDSGQVGVIYITRDEIQKEFPSWKILTKTRLKRIEEMLRSTVKEVDDYLTGNVWGFIVEDKAGEQIESCWGFRGDYEYCLEEAKFAVDGHIRYVRKEHWKQVKTWIRNQVPVIYRKPCPV